LRLATSQRFRLLPFQDRLQSVTGLGDMGEVERSLRLHWRLARRAAAAPVLEVVAHLLRFTGFDGAGVRLLLSHANCRQSVQNGPALDFKFPCEIIDSNFAHPSLFISPARLAVHVSLIEVGI
jgi:hypothetical protein